MPGPTNPDGTPRTDTERIAALEGYVPKAEGRIDHFIHGMRGVMILMLGAWILGAVGMYVALDRTAGQSHRANELAKAIQKSREDSIRQSCEDQNERHDGTIKTLDRLLAKAEQKASPAQKAQLIQSRTFTVLLLESIVPKQNCEARVKALTASVDDPRWISTMAFFVRP